MHVVFITNLMHVSRHPFTPVRGYHDLRGRGDPEINMIIANIKIVITWRTELIINYQYR